MIDPGFFIFLCSDLFLCWSQGANDAANIFGTAVTSRMLRFRTAAILFTLFVIAGTWIASPILGEVFAWLIYLGLNDLINLTKPHLLWFVIAMQSMAVAFRNRRVYEDAMVAQLTARGVKAMPSYLFAPESGPMPLEVMEKALTSFGAAGVLITRVVNVSQPVRVTPGSPPRSRGFRPSRNMGMRGFYGFYDGMWASSFHSPPTITVQENVGADTSLFETKSFAIVWSAYTTTAIRGSGTTTALLQQFSALIAETLAKDGLI
jgi:hypothetical protein